MKIGPVDLERDILVIAEVGNNHEGSIDLAVRLIELAADTGAQAVKFQTIDPERLVATHEVARIKQLKGYSLSRSDHERLARVAERCGVMLMSTPFFLDAVAWLEPFVPAYKIASGDNDFAPLLARVAKTGKPVIMSTGMSDLADVRYGVGVLRTIWKDMGASPGLGLLHCVSAYPTKPEDVNLSSLRILEPMCDAAGFSDHTLGIETAVLSVASGARIIEKHFTIDKNYSDFRDHKVSADPAELRQLVDRVKEVNKTMGRSEKVIVESERAVAFAARRSIVARRDLFAGDVLTINDLDWLRPGVGMSPKYTQDVVGRELVRDVKCCEPLSMNMLV